MTLLNRLPVISVRRLALVGMFTLGFILGLKPLSTYDGWWHLAGGRLIVQEGGIARTDPFSHTAAGQEWVMHEWAWDVALFRAWSRMGPRGVIILKALAAGLTVALLLHLAVRRRVHIVAATAVTALAAVAMSPWFNERPQVLLPLFIAMALHLMQTYRKGRRKGLLLYPVLMLVWVNFHGSFPLGLVLLVLFGLCELLRAPAMGLRRALPTLMVRPSAFLLGVVILSAVACFMNPAGMRGALYPADYFTGEMDWATDTVTEWRSPNWHQSALIPLMILLLGTVAALALSPTSPTPFDLLSVLLGMFMMLTWGRNGAVFIALAAPVAAVHVGAWLQQVLNADRRPAHLVLPGEPVGGRDQLLVRLTVVAFLVLAVAMVPPRGDVRRLVALEKVPVRAAEVMDLNDVQGNLFNPYHWGGYLIWRFYPERPVFIDGRADVYTEEVWRDYLAVVRAQDTWQDVLDRHDVKVVLADSAWPACHALDVSPDFTRIYADPQACLYVRTEGVNAPVVERLRRGELVLPPCDLPAPGVLGPGF